MELQSARYDTVKELKCLHEVMNLHELASEIDSFDEKDTFKNVIHRLFEDMFAEELAEIDAYDRAEQHREDMFWERTNAYLQAKESK